MVLVQNTYLHSFQVKFLFRKCERCIPFSLAFTSLKFVTRTKGKPSLSQATRSTDVSSRTVATPHSALLRPPCSCLLPDNDTGRKQRAKYAVGVFFAGLSKAASKRHFKEEVCRVHFLVSSSDRSWMGWEFLEAVCQCRCVCYCAQPGSKASLSLCLSSLTC